MAKYTKDDPDIQYLDAYDQNNYNFELLKYNVDSNQGPYNASQSAGSIKNMNIKEIFKSPTTFKTGMLLIFSFILLILLIIFFIIYIILYIKGGSENEIKLSIMRRTIIYGIIIILILFLLYWILNKIMLQTTEAGFIAKI